MFATSRFVFLHLPKTAGIYIESVCKEELGMDILYSKRHPTFDRLPHEYKELPLIGVKRNPWDWYASLYYFAKVERNHSTSLFMGAISDGFNLTFSETLAELLSPSEKTIKSYENVLKACGGSIADFECMDKGSFREMKERGVGLLTYLVGQVFPKDLNQLTELWAVETLRKDFFAYVSDFISDREAFRRAMVSPPKNVSNKPNLGLIFNQQDLEAIAVADADLISRWGYVPGFRVGF